MRSILILIFIVSIVSNSVIAAVDNNDLEDILQLTESGLYQKALEKHIWFHEESKSSPGLGGVRLSYAISAWIKLGERYPPALDALINLRDENKEILLSGKGNFTNFHELSSINRKLGDEYQTYKLFLELDKIYPEQAKDYYHVAEDLLIERKEYELCSRYIGDPIYKYENLRNSRELSISTSRRYPELDNPRYRNYTDESFIDGVLNLIEVLVAIGREDDAKEIQKRALSYFYNEKIEYAIH